MHSKFAFSKSLSVIEVLPSKVVNRLVVQSVCQPQLFLQDCFSGSASPCHTQRGGSGYRLDRAIFVLDMGVFANCQGSTSFCKFLQKHVMEAKKNCVQITRIDSTKYKAYTDLHKDIK